MAEVQQEDTAKVEDGDPLPVAAVVEDGNPLPVFVDDSDSSSDGMPPMMPMIFGGGNGGGVGDDLGADLPEPNSEEEEELDPDDMPPAMPNMMMPTRTTTTISVTLGVPLENLAFPVLLEVEEDVNSDTEIGFDEEVVLNGWSMGKKLGEGSYARVVLATKGDKRAAVKIMNKAILEKETRAAMRSRFVDGQEEMIRWTGIDMLASELKVFNACATSDYIINLLEVVEDTRTVSLCLFLELAPLGDVMDWDFNINRFVAGNGLPERETTKERYLTEPAARNYFRCLVLGLKDLHAANIAHLDIKPQNLLAFEPGKAKLTDFGTCLFYDKEDAKLRGSSVGTEHFFSPSSCKSRSRSPYQDDIWAAGVTLYCFLTGVVPFWADNRILLFEAIKKAEVSFPSTVLLSDGAKDLCMKILTKKEKDRISLDDILVHPWMTQ